jgi:glycosyltransferase involved in cell wall biosynthesis
MFVHVPVWEGLGVAVIEALAAGLPVIASQVGGIPELIKDQSTGLLIRPQDPIALADALGRLIHTPGFARALGQAGQAHAQEYFDVHAMARANEVLYYELLTDESDRLTYSHMMKKTSA